MGNLKKKEGFDMSVQLLDKTRKINKLLHNNNSHMVVFNDICEVLRNPTFLSSVAKARSWASRIDRILQNYMS